MSLKQKLIINAVIPFIVILGIFIATQAILSSQKSDGLVINLAGRQRMLCQKMVKELLSCNLLANAGKDYSNEAKSLNNTIKVFDITLDALINGNEAPITLSMSGEHQSCPTPSNNIKQQLEIVENQWKECKQKVQGQIDISFKTLDEYILVGNLKLLKESNKAVGIMQSESEKRVKKILFVQLIGLFIGIIIVLTTLMSVKKILARLNEIQSLTKEFGKGNLVNRISLDAVIDELDETADAVNKLGDSFVNLTKDNIHESNAIISATGALELTTEKIANITSNINDQSESVADSSDTTTNNISTIAAASEEMSSAISTISSSIEEMSASINEVSNQVKSESEIINNTNTLSQDVLTKITKLGESSQLIGKVMGVISDIADKTNLLALNATIEAASAGEAGKGFAVVATEIKELAKQTANATSEIAEQVTGIQEDTMESITSIQNISVEIDKVKEISDTIVYSISEQATTINEIAANLTGSTEAATDVSKGILSIADEMQEMSGNVHSLNTSAGDGTASMEEIKTVVAQLSNTSNSLQASIEKFKI